MAGANWNNPTTGTNYTDFPGEIKDRDVDLALMFDGRTPTNLPTGTVGWDSVAKRFEKWNGSAWVELEAEFAMNVTGLGGNAHTAFAKVANNLSDLANAGTARTNLGLTGDVSTHHHDTMYYTKAAADARYPAVADVYSKAAADARYLQLSGGTLTGDLTIATTRGIINATGALAEPSAGNGRLQYSGGWYVSSPTGASHGLKVRHNATDILTLTTAGALTCSSDITANSDKRVKDDIMEINPRHAAQVVARLRPVTFRYLNAPEDDRSMGFVAQELLRDIPEVVREGDGGLLSVAYGNITAILAGALQDMDRRVKALEG